MDGRTSYYHYVNEAESDDEKRKMKRKHKDAVPPVIIDDFSDLSLSSPPTKIRRLDVKFPPISAMHFKHEDGDEDRLPQLQIGDAVGAGGELCMDEMEAAEVPVAVDANENVNEERALVLYRPVPHHHLNPESNPGIGNLSLSVPSHLIPALTVRDQLIVHNGTEKESLALVPWAPNNFNSNRSCQPEMELCNDDLVEMEMEMEEQQLQQYEEERAQEIINADANGGSLFVDSSHHQRQNQNQKHCMVPQFPLQSTCPATPVAWSR